jgi:hypothetical protein
MQLQTDEVSQAFPWVRELWLLSSHESPDGPSRRLDILAVSDVPPREVRTHQRRRLMANLQNQSDCQVDLVLATGDQLARWLSMGGKFATSFRAEAVKLFERPTAVS